MQLRTPETERMFLLVTSRFRALVALVIATLLFYGRIRALEAGRVVRADMPFETVFPFWLSVVLTAIVYCVLILMAVSVTIGPLRTDEKVFASALLWSVAVLPVVLLFPRGARALKYLQSVLNLISLLAALSMLRWHLRHRPS